MFECKFKLTESDCVQSAKYVYKSQKRKQDKVIAVLIPILMLAMVAMLIVDIVKHKSLVWDIILLAALLILEIIYLVIPLTIVRSQKKSYLKQGLKDMDYLLVTIDDTLCTETLVKNGAEAAKNVHNLKALSSYIEDDVRLVLVFNKVEFVVVKKQNLVGSLNGLKAHLEKIMSKQTKRK